MYPASGVFAYDREFMPQAGDHVTECEVLVNKCGRFSQVGGVRALCPKIMGELLLAKRMQGMSGSVIRDILKLTQSPEVISFAGGLPSPDSFPTAQLRQITADVFAGDPSFLQYGTTEGLPELRQFIARWVGDMHIEADEDSVLVLTGSQQGIDLACRALLNPGDTVLVERPTYLAALQLFQMYGARVIDVPSDENGMDMEAAAAAAARYQPRLVYVIPTFQNPTGICWSIERRQQLAALAEEHDMVILEDDPYGRLRYESEHIPAIAGIDNLQRSIYLGSFSKIISPGLRVGYAVTHPALRRALVIGKQGTDLHTSNLSQRIVAEFGHRGTLERHIPTICAQYKQNRDLMLQQLQKRFPEGASWNRPQGGLFLWVALPEQVSTTRLLEKAISRKVAFIPGVPFFADGGGDNCMRLNFSNASHDNIVTGITRLSETIEEYYL